ncbi:Putative peptidoglycan binding domain protein [uncultured archaeon]|nr:Putative peptidoglycan binding domain protein [uncultured archaeon]
MIGKLIFTALFMVTVICPSVIAQDLSGIWSCDNGGTFYIRQIGNTLWWLGENNPGNPDWADVAKGSIDRDVISLEWADVPKGTNNLQGTLVLRIESDEVLQMISSTGGFGGSNWTRITGNAGVVVNDTLMPITLAVGSTGPLVKTLQSTLNSAGANPALNVDGIFGPKTETAVKAFQKSHGLAQDGIVGPITWKALQNI